MFFIIYGVPLKKNCIPAPSDFFSWNSPDSVPERFFLKKNVDFEKIQHSIIKYENWPALKKMFSLSVFR